MPLMNRIGCVLLVMLFSMVNIYRAQASEPAIKENSAAEQNSTAEKKSATEKNPTAEQNKEEEVEEILVTGEQPGPELFKIYKGDHVLYVLGIISPLPKNMQWHSKHMEEALSNAQEFIYPPEIKLHVGFWSQVALLPSMIGLKDNPDGKKLQDVLPAPIFEHWQQLKLKYMPDDKKVEKLRPIFAASQLLTQSIDKSGMAPADNVRWSLEAIVKAKKITVTHPTILHEFENARTTVKKFKKTSLDDVDCFNKTLERLETDLDGMRARANAWSLGDVEKLSHLPRPADSASCEAAVLNSQLAEDMGLQNLKQTLTDTWVNAAEAALNKNDVSFAILPFYEISASDGYVAQLLARGYTSEF